MNTNTTTETGRRAQEQSEQGSRAQAGQFAKYLVVLWNGEEQAVSFPFEAQHADILRYVCQECGAVRAVSAGLFISQAGACWHGGESLSLDLTSRPQDRQLIEALLVSPDRRLWDLTIAAAEAKAGNA
jgi:hypothetical protein